MRVVQFGLSAIVVALVVFYGLGAALLLIGALAAVYVIGALAAPIMIRARMRVLEKPPLRAFEGDGELPATVRAHLKASGEALGALGFESRDVVHQPVGSAPPAFLALYRHPATSARALARVLLSGQKSDTVLSTDTEFEMRYDNGTSAELSNTGTVAPGLDLIPGIARQMPQVRDVSRLFDYFTKLVARYERESGLSAARRVALADDATLTSVIHDQVGKSSAIQEQAGLLTTPDAAGVRRATWRLAFLVAASGISPGAEFMKRRIASRGERLRRDLDGDSTRIPYERAGVATGWLTFAAGSVFIVAGFVMSPTMACVAAAGMSIAWWITQRKGEPGWRSLVAGGGVAILIYGLPLTVLSDMLSVGPTVVQADAAGLATSFLLPMVLVTAGASLMIEGFRTAAT
ncbi:MAG: hypothetical protein ACRENU_17090 [Gemmatimonadaceae bacterium]